MSTSSPTPRTTKELVERMVQLEQENERLRKANSLLKGRLDQAKGVAVGLITRSTKQNEFTPRQVKDYGEQMLVILNSEKRPKDMRREAPTRSTSTGPTRPGPRR